jgi:hypothetical protein
MPSPKNPSTSPTLLARLKDFPESKVEAGDEEDIVPPAARNMRDKVQLKKKKLTSPLLKRLQHPSHPLESLPIRIRPPRNSYGILV